MQRSGKERGRTVFVPRQMPDSSLGHFQEGGLSPGRVALGVEGHESVREMAKNRALFAKASEAEAFFSAHRKISARH